jgi:glutamine cyclotransferase
MRISFLLVAVCLWPATETQSQSLETYQVIHTYPHDARAFTQGLVYLNGHLYESTGLVGKSSLREEDPDTGRILTFHDVPAPYFAEGLTEWGNTLIQLTWQNHAVFVYDLSTFKLLRTLPFPPDGWGLTHDDKALIESDGTAKLRFLDPGTLRELRYITVTNHGKPVTQLNELEYIHGEIYANIWYADRIARIAPATGKVLGWIDLTGLLPASDRSTPGAVLNGIAYDAVHDRLFVTGKLWPKLFEIRLAPAKAK